jgi:hypothetical protein
MNARRLKDELEAIEKLRIERAEHDRAHVKAVERVDREMNQHFAKLAALIDSMPQHTKD